MRVPQTQLRRQVYLVNLFLLLPILFHLGGKLYAQEISIKDQISAKLDSAKTFTHSNHPLAIELSEAAISDATVHKLPRLAGKGYQILTRIQAESGNYEGAISAIRAGMKIFQDLNDYEEVTRMNIHMGIVHKYLNLFDESISFYKKAEQLADEHGFDDLKAGIYGNLGNVYFQLDRIDEALDSHTKSLEIDDLCGNIQGISNTYHNLAMIYKLRGEYSKADTYYKKSLEIDRGQNYLRGMSLTYNSLATLYMDQGNFNQALVYATNSLGIADSLNNMLLKEAALAPLGIIYAALGEVEKSQEYREQYNFLSDSLQAAELSQQIGEVRTRFETDQQARALEVQKLKLDSQRNSLRQQRLLIIGLGILLVLFGIAAYLFYIRYRLKQKNLQLSLENDQLKLKEDLEEREEIDSIIQDFATSLYDKNTVEEILWDVARNCISRLNFVDSVVYLVDEEKKELSQIAAFGNKNPEGEKIVNPIRIPLGEGIVGTVAVKGRLENIGDTSQDTRYIVDDEQRLSELAVPIIHQGNVIGVIDSEHPAKNFFQQRHVEALRTIAAICGSKIAQALAAEASQQAEIVQVEAEQIKKLDQIKSQFFANISHEFRTPLHLILAPIQNKGPNISSRDMKMMERNGHRLLRLVNQLLDLAKLEVGTLQLEVSYGNILHFLQHIADSFIPLAENKAIQYQIDIPDREIRVWFDTDKFEKIIYNLLSNAIKFTPQEGRVTVHASLQQEESLRIVVSDTGLGVPPELKEKIFERFYQVDGSKTRAHEGTGIGLALTKELVDLQGGAISLDSQEGRGSSFVVILPLQNTQPEGVKISHQTISSLLAEIPVSEKEELEPTIGHLATEKGEKPRILIVEDHQELREHMKIQLKNEFTVFTAANGAEGLKTAKKLIPDLIISDLMMPVMDGISLTKLLKENNITSHIPILMLTAKADTESKREGFERGVDQYLAKPFDMQELRARLKSLWLQHKVLKEKYSKELVIEPTQVSVSDREGVFLEELIQVVDEHIMDEGFTVETLQKKIGMSRMQLHRKLKALTGQSASEFIRNIRLKRAAQLLRDSNMQVAEAAYQSGFSHLSYFSKCFKAQYGILPSEYAKQAPKKV